MNTKNLLTATLQAAAIVAVFLYAEPAKAVPPYKVPGQGYFDGDMVKDKGKCQTRRSSKNCGKCESKAEEKKCRASAGCVKGISARQDSAERSAKPYWKRKIG